MFQIASEVSCQDFLGQLIITQILNLTQPQKMRSGLISTVSLKNKNKLLEVEKELIFSLSC